jgi:hypothetical protein
MLASLAVWIVFFFFVSAIAGAIAGAAVPVDESSTIEALTRNATLEGALSRISPCTLYGEATIGLLTPEVGTMNSALYMMSYYSGRMSNPLPLQDSLLLVWPLNGVHPSRCALSASPPPTSASCARRFAPSSVGRRPVAQDGCSQRTGSNPAPTTVTYAAGMVAAPCSLLEAAWTTCALRGVAVTIPRARHE